MSCQTPRNMPVFWGAPLSRPHTQKQSISPTMTPLTDRRPLRLRRSRTRHIPMSCFRQCSPENIHLPSDTPLLPAPPQPPPCRSTYGCCGWVPASASASFRLLPPPSASASVHPVRSACVRLPKPRQTRAASRERVPLLRHASSEVSVVQFHPFFRKTLSSGGPHPTKQRKGQPSNLKPFSGGNLCQNFVLTFCPQK